MVLAKNTEDFPRSDVSSRINVPSTRGIVKRQNDQLFKKKNSKPPISRENEKKKRKKKSDINNNDKNKKENTKVDTKGPLNKVVIEFMDVAKLPEGMLVYGCIEEIDDFELKFCITGGISVKVPITNISRSYTKLIELFTNDQDPQNSETELSKLQTMFQIGDYYPVKILSKSSTTQFGHTEVIGSISSVDIYEGFNAKTLNSLPSGYPLYGSVSTIEDYGYGIDLGIDNAKAFLSFEECKKNYHLKLNIGQPVYCAIIRADDRSITLTNNKKKIGTVLNFESQISITNFVPGTKTNLTITGIHRTGLELSLPGDYKGFVPQYHVSENLSDSTSKINLNDTFVGTVLYVQPHTKQVCISLKGALTKKTITSFKNTFNFGMIIKNATVCGKGMMGSIIFRIDNKHYAFCRKKNLTDRSESDESHENDTHFNVGTQHVCKIKNFNLFDHLIEVSLKKSFIEKETLNINELSACQKFDCTVKRHDPKGIFVKLGPGVDGFVPMKHLTDAPFKNMNMEKMFPLKSTVKCRIMKIDTNSKTLRLSLTMKKTLLGLPEEQIFRDFDHIQPGMTSTGVVCLIQQQGILVEFFGSVAAFVPLKNLATYKIEHPDKVFTVGQIVKVTIVSVNPEEKRMIGTLIDIKNIKKLDKSRSMNSKLQIGQILKKMIVLDKNSIHGLDLINYDETIKVFLPIGHLCDDPYLSQLIFMSLKKGDVLDKVMVFRKDLTNTITVTKKSIFVDQEKIIKSEDDIEMNVPFPAVVRNVGENGIFFEIPGGYCGVLRKKYFQDNFYDKPEKLGLKKNQTIFVSAVESLAITNDNIDDDPKRSQQLKRFKFSMKLSDVWDKTDQFRTDYMKNYLNNHSWIVKMLSDIKKDNKTVVEDMKRLIQYSIGQIVKFTVEKIDQTCLVLKIGQGKNSSVGFASKWNDEFESFSIDQVGEAVVCDYDFEKSALRVFIQPIKNNVIKHIKSITEDQLKTVKLDQIIKGQILWIGNRHLLVCLSGHVPGAIAFVASRRHYNDCGHIESLFTIGSEHHFKIKAILDDQKIIAVLSTEAKSETNKVAKEKKKSKMSEEDRKKKIEARRAEKKAKKAKLRNERRLNKLGNVGNDKNNTAKKDEISSEEFQWDIPDPTPNLAKKRKLELTDIPVNIPDISSDELLSDNDNELENHKKKKRKTKSELSKERNKREIELKEKEANLTDHNRKLKNENDYEISVISQPNSSIVWLKYMSFYLEKGNLGKAREIAERALEKISFREEKEKMNIWIGLLNLENTFGDKESMDNVLERALKYNDPKAIYLQLASIYEQSDKRSKAEEIYQLMLKKFKQDKTVWIEYLLFLMKIGKIDLSRKQFQKSLLSLDKKDHVDVISKFAQLEFKFGDCEQAKTIFEQMLATYWKRLDQWSIYVDMLIKYTMNQNDSLEYVRNVFERLISFKYSPERMKFVFKKYYDFEQKFNQNDSEVLDRIKQKALEYFDKDIF